MRVIVGIGVGMVMAGVMTVGAALASGPPLVLDIPGLAAARIELAGVSRLDDGGALMAVSLNPSGGTAGWRLAIVRLLVDGAVDLGYGSLGIATPGLGRDVQATSLAINPGTGGAWVGVAYGRRGRGAIVALDGEGNPITRFGAGGELRLATAGGPAALAWRQGQLLVASGDEPCHGCVVSVVNAATGRTLESARLAASELSGGRAGCGARAITSAVFESRRTVLIAAQSTGHHCGALLLSIGTARLTERGSHAIGTAPFGTKASTVTLAAFGRNLCVAGGGRGATEFGPLSGRGKVDGATRGPAGRVTGLVALGGRACAMLLTRGPRRGVVLQAAGGRAAVRATLTPTVEPLGMFRCHQHLLVIGARRGHGDQTGVVVVVPVRRGPEAGLAAASAGVAECRS